MNTVEFLNIKTELPSEWDEFTTAQVEVICQMLATRMDVVRFRTALAIECLGIRKRLYNYAGGTYYVPGWSGLLQVFAFRSIARKKNAWKIDKEQMFFVSELFKFMFEEKEDKDKNITVSRKVMLTRNHFPVIAGFPGPADYFGDVVAAEYITAENHYSNFMAEPSEEHLNLLCATLYRPRKIFYLWKRKLQTTDADPRVKFDDDYATHAGKFARIPFWQKFAVAIWFEGVRNNLAELYPEVYQQSDDSDFTGEESTGWTPIISSIAENVTKVEDVLYTNIHTLLAHLSEKIKTAKKNKRK